jgi:DNA helicase HerA-like ATPase
MLLVIDEAHNVCPQEPSDHNQALAVEQAVNIAAEGRKFGIYLLLATQRPQKVHANVLTQCENLILMRMTSSADIAYLAEVFSHVPRALIEQSSGFELGEGLVAGRIVPFPSLFRTGARRSPEGGSDVPTSWARRA